MTAGSRNSRWRAARTLDAGQARYRGERIAGRTFGASRAPNFRRDCRADLRVPYCRGHISSVNDCFGIFDDVAAVGIVVGLVVGKLSGVFGASWVTARLTGAELDPSVSWLDMVGLALLSGIGFTVSLLMAELAYDDQPERLADAKLAILVASLIAAGLATVVLRLRDRAYHRASEADT